ncbi:MAG: alanine--tRNA ligase [Prevotellaceae bacterium]|jgi:alanyl-tRNA synthetase|nr:alanine--tRNA ligase [Prevotellaceae bacterium]
MNSKQVRSTFLEFFRSKGHAVVSSAPMVVKNDPTLMFTNAGMNQFKDIFLGNEHAQNKRVADTQKCLRVSGKHNDLEEVGRDTYHHTMFEMLGNWSFGDYFKKDAIEWAWELLHKIYALPADRLYATVFDGATDDGTEKDHEALECWKRCLPKERILSGSKKDNFWEMGEVGPCGPCSEIHIDLRDDEERAKIDGASLVNTGHPQVIEIWNLVFMQFNRKADGSLEPLPAKHVDTGMGFERLCMALQGKKSNYDTDIFQPIIAEISKLSGKKYGEEPDVDIAMRVVADHLRALSFSIADGQLPSNVKAGYVIRRILRRAVRYGYSFLGFDEPFICKLVPVLVAEMGEAFPELVEQKALVEKVIGEEEASFLRTLGTGIRMLEKLTEENKTKGATSISGIDAFTLYDTYGFPPDLTELILQENNMTMNKKEFDVEMQKQKDRARNAGAQETGDWTILAEGDTAFVGYDFTDCDCRILRFRQVKQKSKEFYQIVLDKTPFYAEMGGQVGDKGKLTRTDGVIINIFDTKKDNNLSVHLTDKLPEDLSGIFRAEVDVEKRVAIECNHTATHLLHEALREVLGSHVEQKGSFVSSEVLRFDFSHFQKLSDEEIREIEKHVTAKIRENIPLDETREMPINEAKKAGATALFGEKYGDKVRVVRFGSSVELCGGTHISSTGRIGSFRVLSESSIAAGIRRIEAITAEACERYFYFMQDTIRDIRAMFNNTPNLAQALKKLFDEDAELRKAVEDFRKEKIIGLKNELKANVRNINGINAFVFQGHYPPDAIKDVALQLRSEFPERYFFAAGCEAEGKPSLILALSDDLVNDGLNASQIIRSAAKHIQGGGGGQAHFATAGGKNIDGLAAAMDEIVALI